MWKRVLLLAALLAPSVACLEIQGTHTLYLAPDGTVVWTVLEQGIRLNAATEDFLRKVSSNEHQAAVSLEALYPGSLNSRILREETPQAILTEAHFPGIDRVYQNLFGLYGVVSVVQLQIEEERARLEIVFWVDDDEEEEVETERDEAADEAVRALHDEILLALLVECRIVLTEGEFIEAKGFEIVDGGRVAKPLGIDTDEAEENDTPITLSLTWTTSGEAHEESSP
jgi:hypothetical protein